MECCGRVAAAAESSLISYPVDASRYLGMWLDLTSHRQTWLFSSTSTYHSTDLLTARGVAHLVVYGTTGSTSYETIPPFVRLESSGGVLSTVDMMVQRRDGPRWLRELYDDDDDWESHSLGILAIRQAGVSSLQEFQAPCQRTRQS